MPEVPPRSTAPPRAGDDHLDRGPSVHFGPWLGAQWAHGAAPRESVSGAP